MSQPLSLLDFLRGLQTDAGFRSAFAADPEATIAEHGLGDLGPDDIHDALVLVEDNETADFDHDFAGVGTVHIAPPPVHVGEEQHAAQYLSEYLAATFPGPDAPAVDDWSTGDPDADLDPLFASGSSEPDVVDGPGADGHDAVGFGDGAGTPAAGVDLGADHDPDVDADFGADHAAGIDTGFPGHHDVFGGGAEAFGEPGPHDTAPSVSGADSFLPPGHAAADTHTDEPPHPIY